MKKTRASKGHSRVSDELRPEYHFDYARARRNRFASRAQKGPLVVVLDEDIARVFKTRELVRAVLRAIASTMSPGGKRSTAGRTAEG
jgi:hypothetical protein